MATPLEIRVNQKQLLGTLLKIKSENIGVNVNGLQEAIKAAVNVMEQEDVAYTEKIYGVKAL